MWSSFKLNIEIIEKRFGQFLEKFWGLSDIAPFILVYIRLLLLFKDELPAEGLSVLLERQKQLRGEAFNGDQFNELLCSTRRKLDRHLGNNTSTTKESVLNNLLFCALLDTEESDFFYLTEPVYEFVNKMEVSPDELLKILEAEFKGFKA